MKRPNTDEDSFITWPVELLIEIARQGRWLVSGSLARCSKQLIHEFTRAAVLKEIIESIKSSGARLLKWLVLALPSQYLSDTLTKPSLSVNELLTPDVFLSGGQVCQHLYGVAWQGDTDVYVHNKGGLGHRIISQNTTLDLITTELEDIERVIESFDLSIVQQGFLGDSYYVTPLSLYTKYSREIIVMPDETNIQYRYSDVMVWPLPPPVLTTTQIWTYISRHLTRHKYLGLSFHECRECDGYCGNDVVAKWHSRVTKYVERFPTFTHAYCRPPQK